MKTKNRFFVAYSPDNVIWGIGNTKKSSIEDALKWLQEYELINQEHYPLDVLDSIESTFRLYERILHHGYSELKWEIRDGKANLC